LWAAELKNGQSLSGTVASETAATITLRDAAGRETTLSRADLERLEASDLSAMPQGLENGITEEEMTDLLAYLKGGEMAANCCFSCIFAGGKKQLAYYCNKADLKTGEYLVFIPNQIRVQENIETVEGVAVRSWLVPYDEEKDF
jgi:hypothetical protein